MSCTSAEAKPESNGVGHHPAVTVRLATWRDAQAVFLLREALDRECTSIAGIPIDSSDEMMARVCHHTNSWFFDGSIAVLLAERDGKPVGYAMLTDSLVFGRSRGMSIAAFYVADASRNTAVVVALYREMLRFIACTNAKRSQCIVAIGNERMERFVAAKGFKPVAVIYNREIEDGWSELWRKKGPEVHREGLGRA